MCAITLPHINMLTFYTILIIYNHNNRIQSVHFCAWLLYGRINKVMSFCTWFWPKVIHIGKEANYPRKQPNCTYQCKYIVLQIAVPDVASKSWPKTGAFTTYCSNNVIQDNKSQQNCQIIHLEGSFDFPTSHQEITAQFMNAQQDFQHSHLTITVIL